MSSAIGTHQSVLVKESLDALITDKGGVYVDQTFGCGGHSKAILNQLNPSGRLIAFDKDPEAVKRGFCLAKTDKRFCVVHQDFLHFDLELDRMGVGFIDGTLFDLGVSSPQLDEASRGFSFRFDAPLDMRMDTTKDLTAAQWLEKAKEADIARVIKEYGEERFAKKIAKAIVMRRENEPIRTTAELAKLIQSVVKTYETHQHPATRTFQAIRIYINNELNALADVLPKAMQRLRAGGKLVVISFHSLEDRLVKQFMRFYSQSDHLPRWAAVKHADLSPPLLDEIHPAKHASEEEIKKNLRARSAILRVARRSFF